MKPNIILIDFENVQPRELAPLRGGPYQVKVFCGATQTKLPRDLVIGLQPLGADAEYIPIQGSGRNALDFHIAYYIGRLAVKQPGATFYIISRDAGFDPLIKHLQTQDIRCHRLPSLSGIAGLGALAHGLSPDRIGRIAENLLKRKDSRPRKVKPLNAYIRAQLGAQATEPEVSEVIARLEQGGMVVSPDGKVNWPPGQLSLRGLTT